VCVFENCQPPDYNDRHQLTCLAGAWTLTALSTCEMGPCPATPTVPGSACDEDFTPGPCTFVDACAGSYEVLCIDGSWQTSVDGDSDAPYPEDELPAPPVPECPLYPPYLGDPCCPTAVPEVCDYTQGGPDGAAGASFIILPGAATSGGGAEPPPTLSCAVCSAQMTWASCPIK